MASPKQKIGQTAETKACDYLESQGLQLVEKNFSHLKGTQKGEIDLIMKEGDYVVFVEVRYRKNKNYQQALESITTAKQNKIVRTATHYLLENHYYNKVDCRFDVVAMDTTTLYWIKNAFNVESTL